MRTFCHAGDDICKGGDAVLKDHLTYGMSFCIFSCGYALGSRDLRYPFPVPELITYLDIDP